MTAKSPPELDRDRALLDQSLLREQQAAAFGASIDGLAIFDSNQRIIYMNEAHSRIYGYSGSEELIGKTWQVLYDGAELDRFQTWIMPGFFSSGQWRGEAIGRRKDGSHFPQEVSLSVVRGGGLVCVVRDISERKRLEERHAIVNDISISLSESVDYQDTIERIARVAVPRFSDFCMLRLKPMRRFPEVRRVTAAHPDHEALLAKVGENVLCKDPDSSCLVNFAAGGEEAERAPFPLSELGVVSYVYAPLRVRGEVIGNLTFLRTTRHPQGPYGDMEYEGARWIASRSALALENSRLYMEAQEAVQLQENLMSTVSHDLKNPLMAIGINVEILNRLSQRSPIEPQLRAIAHNIKVSVDQMSYLVSQLLEYEKLRHGGVPLQKQAVRVSKILGQVAALFGPLAERKNIRLELKSEPPQLSITCDPERVIQVLSNIVGNAFKFTHSGGRVTVEAVQGDCETVFSVTDTGIGIRKEDLAHVFELHWQSSTTSSQGTGLGLTIAKSIVEAHGGRIWATSRVGAGSTFSFSVPLL